MTSVRGSRKWRHLPHALGVLIAVAVTALVIWLDVQTGVWQEMVVLSGVAAGLVTFLLTALFLDKILARSAHRRWFPVTRLALTDLLHTLAAEDSEVSRGDISPRKLVMPGPDPDGDGNGDGDGDDDDELPGRAAVGALLQQVLEERECLTAALGRWSAFLAASADVQVLMAHLAAIAEQLEQVRTAAMAFEQTQRREGHRDLQAAISRHNDEVAGAVKEIHTLLSTPDPGDEA